MTQAKPDWVRVRVYRTVTERVEFEVKASDATEAALRARLQAYQLDESEWLADNVSEASGWEVDLIDAKPPF